MPTLAEIVDAHGGLKPGDRCKVDREGSRLGGKIVTVIDVDGTDVIVAKAELYVIPASSLKRIES